MRVLTNKPNELKIRDAISNTVITFYYNRPDHARRMKFFVSLYTKSGSKIFVNSGEYLEAGKDILSGIGENNFCTEDGKPISSDPQSPHYNQHWKELVCESASDLVAELAKHVFDGMNVINEGAEKSQVVLEENVLPLEGASAAG
jgi:hypothetical protein